ncbi:cation:proton antiporter [Natronobiforma cellulositropha]|uniref:cation:proton antiporter n=1 Tax=Natronobiforma cellulositropha TaxID=1679076 RepID=UPI0021D5EF10|nr:cation:proton antiporter [Natronobiforma cellulositropha]
MVVFLVAPLVLQRYRLPGIVGIILVGAAVGPNGLGLLERGETIQLLGEVGLIYLLFIAGLEINLNQFVEYRNRSIVFGLLTFLIPQAVGTAVGVAVLGLTFPAALLFASIFASHTLLAYPVVSRLGIAKNEAMTTTIGGTILTDTLALLVLAVVIASTEGDLDGAFWFQLSLGLAVFFVGVWLVVPRLGRWFFRVHSEESYFEFLFVMAILFIAAFAAEMAGVEHIIGAFLAGLALNRLIPESGPLMNRIQFVGNALFIPFFLLSVGMLVDVWVLADGTETLVVALTLIVLVIVTKLAAAWVTGWLYDYSSDEVLGMFGLSVGQAAAALAIVLIAFESSLPGFAGNQHMINGVVLMILVVSLLSPAVVERAGSAIVRARAHETYDPSDSPQRILVPTSRESRYRESLLDLALAVRDERSSEPIHALSVVRPRGGIQTEADVADAEALLEEMETYAAGAEVPIVGHTRVNHNVASGIVRSSVENRISTIVIGWDGARSRAQHVFGHTIDQVLNRTSQLTLVGRVREPINTTTRIVLILPPGIEHNPGIYETVHTVKHLSEQTGASIHGVVVGGDPEAFDRSFDLVEPEVPSSFESVPDWDALRSKLRRTVRTGDFVVCTSARRDDPGWHPELQRLPKHVSRLTAGNFVIVYPAGEERVDDRRFLRLS